MATAITRRRVVQIRKDYSSLLSAFTDCFSDGHLASKMRRLVVLLKLVRGQVSLCCSVHFDNRRSGSCATFAWSMWRLALLVTLAFKDRLPTLPALTMRHRYTICKPCFQTFQDGFKQALQQSRHKYIAKCMIVF